MYKFATDRMRKPKDFIGLRAKFDVGHNELEMMKFEPVDQALLDNLFTSVDESSETNFVVKAEPISPCHSFNASSPQPPDDDEPNFPPFLYEFSAESEPEVLPFKSGKGKQTYNCDLCDYSVVTFKQSLERHMKITHIKHPVIIYKCKQCEKTFTNKQSVRRHERYQHSANRTIRIIECNICGEEFKWIGTLNYHKMKAHDFKSEFQCSYCSKMCSTKGTLKSHEMSHSEDRTFVCQTCSKGFKTMSSLKFHERKHTEPECFCDVCGNKMKNSITLQKHMKFIHADVKKFRCIKCQKQFKTPKDYKEHLIAIHTSLRPWSCPWCSRTFNNGPNFIKHKRETHPEQHEKMKGQEVKKTSLPSFDELHAMIRAELE